MSGSTTGGDGSHHRSVSDAIPDAEPLPAAHATYEKGEVSSIGALISDISGDLTTLLRQEVELAKVEATQAASRAGKGAGMLAGAGVAAHFLLLFLSLALWAVLADALDSWAWAFVLVAVVWGVVAAILAAVGRKELTQVNKLDRSVDTVKKVPGALKGNEAAR